MFLSGSVLGNCTRLARSSRNVRIAPRNPHMTSRGRRTLLYTSLVPPRGAIRAIICETAAAARACPESSLTTSACGSSPKRSYCKEEALVVARGPHGGTVLCSIGCPLASNDSRLFVFEQLHHAAFALASVSTRRRSPHTSSFNAL